MLDKQTYSDDRVAAASTNWVMVRIDVDRNQALASYYNVQSIPTIMVLNAEGKEIRREVGFIGVGPMLTLMEKGAN
jgi:thioredoxin-like negative regulator of GroEL